ncbi:MAG: RidA family protein [Actinomycetota bacterium]|jgi:enamine deaminase RidA (YjgF/YER057c/UK114 family)|nr:RidA family protein [Actinomycetota bacterium]
MAERQNISGGGPLEAIAGYSRAVRIGGHVGVAGTTTLTADGVLFPNDCYEQTRETLAIVGRALVEAGASFADVVRTRAFITDVSMADDFMRAHGEVFADIRPVATLVEVSALVHPDLVIEIEADAIVS